MIEEVAKQAMLLRERVPPEPSPERVGEMSEVFDHPLFREGSQETREHMMLSSARAKYASELDYPWDAYFGFDLTARLEGKHLLDLGCFTGGRTKAWKERYRAGTIAGVDVNQDFIDGAKRFCEGDFRVGSGEAIPFDAGTFEAILSFDVLEHVRDVPRTLSECWRVLRPGGEFYLVFPSYWQPAEHHLSMVTRTPGLQYLFSARTLLRAYADILRERGRAAAWYRRDEQVEPWERGNTINGTTARRFAKMIGGWEVVHQSHAPIGSIGRNASKDQRKRLIGRILRPFAYVPGLQEAVLHRITYVLRKPSSP
jgi:SAM-dependent methyltransferase